MTISLDLSTTTVNTTSFLSGSFDSSISLFLRRYLGIFISPLNTSVLN